MSDQKSTPKILKVEDHIYFQEINMNPNGYEYARLMNDCAIRACCAASRCGWDKIYAHFAYVGFKHKISPYSDLGVNLVLQKYGFFCFTFGPDDTTTVRDVIRKHPNREFVISASYHTVFVKNQCIFDMGDPWHPGEVPSGMKPFLDSTVGAVYYRKDLTPCTCEFCSAKVQQGNHWYCNLHKQKICEAKDGVFDTNVKLKKCKITKEIPLAESQIKNPERYTNGHPVMKYVP